MRLVALINSVGIAVLPRLAQAQTDCAMPSAGEDRWPVATPESAGLISARLCEMVKLFNDWKRSNVHAVLVARHGTLVFEHYFSGRDELWGQPIGEVAFGPETKHDVRSATKSITALVGTMNECAKMRRCFHGTADTPAWRHDAPSRGRPRAEFSTAGSAHLSRRDTFAM